MPAKRGLFALVSIVLAAVAYATRAADENPYEYPIVDPFEATVIGTPPHLKYQIPSPKKLQERIYSLDVFPGRQVPEVLWHARRLRFNLAYQNEPAPLIFIIPGTGANYRSPSVRFLSNTLYQSGFHVIALSSPTSYDFVTSGSTSRLPGISAEDAHDLYRVMKMAADRVASSIEVSGYYLAGYSLGALQAAFVSHLDESEEAFAFRKVVMLNPPVNLYQSAQIIDKLSRADANIVTANQLFDRLFAKFAEYFRQHGKINIGDDAFLFKFQESRQSLSHSELKVLIGAAFRFAAANLVFTADLLNNSGFVIEKDADLKTASSLTTYFTRALWWRFTDYFEHMLVPYWKQRHPQDQAKDLINKMSLAPLADYLTSSQKIHAITNADDIILGDGDLEFLRKTFGRQAMIFPTGGHLGNLRHDRYVRQLLAFLKETRG